MTRYHFIAASILLGMTFSAESLLSHQAGTFFTSNDLGEIHQRALNEEDLIVLADGTELTGEIPTLPSLRFSFGTLPLDMNDVAAIAFSIEEGQGKMQVITQDDYSFVCDVSNETIRLVQYFPSREKSTRTINHEVGLQTISHILFRDRGGSTYPEPRRLYVLALNNGDELPVAIRDERIHLSNGWRDFILQTDRIIDVSFDGGLYGVLDGEKGKQEELDYSFVRGKFLHVQIVRTSHTLGIPWDQVKSIRKVETAAFRDKAVLKGFQENVPDSHDATKTTEPSRIFTQDSLNEEQYEFVWIPNETIDGYVAGDEESKRIVAAADTTTRSKSRRSEARSSLTDLARKSQDFQKELGELRALDAAWENRNGELTSKLNSCSVSQEELLRRQNLLVAGLELELTRTKQLRNALNDAVAKWDKARSYSKVMEKRLKDVVGGKNVNFSGIENEAELFVEVNAYRKALEDERAVTAELEKQVVNLSNAVEEAKQKEEEGEQNTSSYQNKIAQLTEELEKEERYTRELEGKLVEMSVEVGEFEKKFTTLKDSVIVKKEEIEELQESQDSLYESLLQKIDILTEEKRATEDRQDELEAKINELVTNLSSGKDYSDELQQQLNDMAETSSSFESQLVALNEVLSETTGNLQEEVEEQDVISKEVSGQIDALADDLENETERANSLKEELLEAIERSESTERETSTLEQQFKEAFEKTEEQERTVAALENEVAVNVLELDQKEQQVNDLLVRLAEYENDIEQYEEQIQTIELKLDDFEKESETQTEIFTQRIEELRESLEQSQQDNEQLRQLIREYEEQKLELEDEVALRQRSIDEVKEQNQARSVDNAFKVQELEIQLGDALDNCEQLQVLKSELEEQLTREREHFAGVEEEFLLSDKALEERNEELQNFSNAYFLMQNKLTKKNESLQNSVEEERSRVQELQNVIGTQSSDAVSIQELETRLEAVLGDLGDIQNEKRRLEEEFELNKTTLSEKTGELEYLSTDYIERQTQLNEQIELLQNTIEEERNRVQDLEGSLNEKTSLEEELLAVKTAYTEKTDQLQNLARDHAEMQDEFLEQIDILKLTIEEEQKLIKFLQNEIEARVEENSSTRYDLEIRLDEALKNLEQAKEQKRDLEEKLGGLNRKIGRLEDQELIN